MATKSKFIEEDDATARAGLKGSDVNVTKLLYKDKKTDNSIQLFLKLFFIVFFKISSKPSLNKMRAGYR